MGREHQTNTAEKGRGTFIDWLSRGTKFLQVVKQVLFWGLIVALIYGLFALFLVAVISRDWSLSSIWRSFVVIWLYLAGPAMTLFPVIFVCFEKYKDYAIQISVAIYYGGAFLHYLMHFNDVRVVVAYVVAALIVFKIASVMQKY